MQIEMLEQLINEDTDSAQTIRLEVDSYKWKGVTFPITNFSKGIERAALSRQNSYFFFGANKRKSFIYSKPNLQEEALSEKKSFGLRNTSFRKFYK